MSYYQGEEEDISQSRIKGVNHLATITTRMLGGTPLWIGDANAYITILNPTDPLHELCK